MTDEEIDIAAMEYADEYDNSLEYCAARDAFIAGGKMGGGTNKKVIYFRP